jgi:transcriptional regulator with XRE-family HTH domain
MTDNFGRNLDYRLDVAIKVLRTASNLTQLDLAKRLKTSRTYITKLERRRRDPTIQTVNKLARAFKLSPRRLMELATIKA